jgi:hypothetical protein
MSTIMSSYKIGIENLDIFSAARKLGKM